ncbi:MCE family protein [Pseudonocardia parietis]|uniref:Phospholipid/cholesterol/gamma-HCH transport system substrate-binding protein n=1 Tax=Pseudonocardia parietis TaxID=570936 RepID=A0ABS4VLL0_9PSEU|nr:MlaD family protein [Pseudonocardia parietis]MBP2364802.1 phospholipid/cholesterol/gamma-HCH transport system substrate-binding protein [Pseudonocardia parietis]
MNRRSIALLAAGVAVLLVIGVITALSTTGQRSATAFFENSTGLYEGDEVRILGVPVGVVDRITPDGPAIRVEFSYDADQPVPADAKAAIVAPSLVTSRYLQLAPRYTGGPVLPDDAEIPIERTAVPVEWDEIKEQLSRLSTELGPQAGDPQGSLARALGVGAETLGGQGAAINETITELSRAMTTLAGGSDDLFATVRNLQVFTEALSTSDRQIVEFGQRLASVSGVLAENEQQLGRAVVDLRETFEVVHGFVEEHRERLGTSVRELDDLSGLLVENQDRLAKVLHAAPTPLVNLYNAYQPGTASVHGQVAVGNFANPALFVCSGIAAAGALPPDDAARVCAEQLGPLLNVLTMNYPPVSVNPLTRQGTDPGPGTPIEAPDRRADILPPLTGPGGLAEQVAPGEGTP